MVTNYNSYSILGYISHMYIYFFLENNAVEQYFFFILQIRKAEILSDYKYFLNHTQFLSMYLKHNTKNK